MSLQVWGLDGSLRKFSLSASPRRCRLGVGSDEEDDSSGIFLLRTTVYPLMSLAMAGGTAHLESAEGRMHGSPPEGRMYGSPLEGRMHGSPLEGRMSRDRRLTLWRGP